MPLFRRRSLIHYSLFPAYMRPMFFATLLYNIAGQMVGIFLPLFLFEIGRTQNLFSFLRVSSFVSGVLLAIAYYLFQRVVVLFAMFPLAKIIVRIGYVPSMVLGTLCLFINFLGYLFARQDPRFLILSFVAGGGELILYWFAHDSLFASEVRVKEIGRGIGAIEFLIKLIQIAVPAVAGGIIAVFGYGALFLCGMVFLVLSFFPLVGIPRVKVWVAPTLGQFFTWLREYRFRKFALVQFGKYMDIVAIQLWPIYVLLLVGKIERVGVLFSLTLFISLLLTYATGWFVDHKKGKRAFIASGTLISLSWLMRFFVRGVWDIVGVEFLDKLAASVYNPCYDSFLCMRSKGRAVFAFYVYKELLLTISAIILWAVAFGLFLLPLQWASVFIFGAVGVFLSLFLDARK